jgi:hypothetical protein
VGKCSGEGVGAAVALDAAARPDGGVLLGDGQQLEPDAVGLERAQQQGRREIVERAVAAQGGLDLRLAQPHYLEQPLEQEIDELDDIGVAADGGLALLLSLARHRQDRGHGKPLTAPRRSPPLAERGSGSGGSHA